MLSSRSKRQLQAARSPPRCRADADQPLLTNIDSFLKGLEFCEVYQWAIQASLVFGDLDIQPCDSFSFSCRMPISGS
jgi:hypothetical protein